MRTLIITLMLLLLSACATAPHQTESSVAQRIIDCPTAPGGGPLFLNCQ